MTRATNPDGTPWWVSTGPPQPSAPAEAASADMPHAEPEETPAPSSSATSESASESSSSGSFFGITPESQAAALNAGLNLVTAVLDAVSRPLTGEPEQASTHDVSACGVCPLCVGLKSLREHDEELADLVESAMSGVTSSIEKLTGLLPEMAERAAEALAGSLIKIAFKNMAGK